MEQLYDHYKETCSICREQVKERDKLFLRMCILIILIFFLEIRANDVLTLLIAYIKETYKCDLSFQTDLITTFFWIFLLYFMLGYYKTSINLERQYAYIHILENSFNSNQTIFKLEREGKNYLNEYPLLLNIINFLYKVLMPCIYTLILLIGLRNNITNTINIFDTIQICISLICILLTILFIIEIKK